ncbi:sucrase ferredoxin [Nakamurella deserti]|uniref:sucrase ferredoxin n=1 Tax=Nakamurella deserti TaxID=2164074 RepID=UPI0013008CA8|nr:sucrase ferredoxin [Nakamurella deserti]
MPPPPVPVPPTLPTPPVMPLCSDADAAVDDDPRGSAAAFRTFVLIEHPAGFGREAADDAVSAVYGRASPTGAATPGLRPFAIRPVGRAGSAGSRVRWVGRTGPASFLRPTVATPSAVELSDLATAPAVAAGPLFAVCTNGSRDRCCALKGRDLAAALHDALDDPGGTPSVVEISHLGGHRYAPTMLVLPWGYAYAWLDPDRAVAVARAARDGLVHPDGLRGRADLSPPAQVAEALWRAELGPAPVGAIGTITVHDDRDGNAGKDGDDDATFLVSARVDGRDEIVRLTHRPGPVIGATACGGKPIATGRWTRA